ncbi:MAG: cobyrinic acid a,c-diamide synthase, partial [Candidatus Zixiibacteriota bacterium]
SIIWNGHKYKMSGIFPLELKMNKKPAGHGYTILKADKENPFFEVGEEIRGHEFHYSSPIHKEMYIDNCMAVTRGNGIDGRRDGLVYKNCYAGYTHIHASGNEKWAPAFISIAIEYKKESKDVNFKIAV